MNPDRLAGVLAGLVLLASARASAGGMAIKENADCGAQCLPDDEFDTLMDETQDKVDSEAPYLIAAYKAGRRSYKPSDLVKLAHRIYHGDDESKRGKKSLPFTKGDFVEWQGDVYKGVGAFEAMARAKALPEGPQKQKAIEDAKAQEAEITADFQDDLKRTDPVGKLYMATDDAFHKLNPPPPNQPPYDPSWGQIWNPASSATSDGYGKLASGDPAGAKAAADNALALDPGSRDAFDLRGKANFDLHDYGAAAQDARAALGIDPNDKTAQAIYGLSHDRDAVGAPAGSQAAASALSDAGASAAGAAFSAAPGALSSRRGAAPSSTDIAAQLALRDYQAALAASERAIQANPGDTRAYFYSAVAHMKLHDPESALRDAVAGLAVDPKNTALLDAKAEALNRMGRYRDALAAASAALELNPKDPYAYYNKGLAYFGLKDRDASLAALRQAAALDPQFQAVAERAAQAPTDADLAFLLPDLSASPAAAALPGQKAGRFGFVAVSSVVGGLLIALGLLQLVMEPVKSAFTRLTRRASSPASFETVRMAPLAEDGSPGLLRGQYQVLRRIGQGGMGVVYEGRDVALERKVAIKRMREELKRDPRERQRFVSEAKLVAALHHPNIVDIYAIVEEGSEVYLVFEHISGRTIHELLGGGRMPLERAAGLLRGVAAALDYAHAKGVIHRDLKPSNIMVDGDGRVRVMDFGIARAAKDALTRQSMTNTIVGTPPYMAPEQEQGVVRREADVYALGVCLYEMLTGRLPFAGSGAGMLLSKVNGSFPQVSSIVPGLPAGLDAVLASALQPDPAKRLPTAGSLVQALDGLLARRPA